MKEPRQGGIQYPNFYGAVRIIKRHSILHHCLRHIKRDEQVLTSMDV